MWLVPSVGAEDVMWTGAPGTSFLRSAPASQHQTPGIVCQLHGFWGVVMGWKRPEKGGVHQPPERSSGAGRVDSIFQSVPNATPVPCGCRRKRPRSGEWGHGFTCPVSWCRAQGDGKTIGKPVPIENTSALEECTRCFARCFRARDSVATNED